VPKSTQKLRQYGVRVNGVLIRKSFARASEARAWQREQKKVQDEIRAGIKRYLDPVLMSVQAVAFLKSRKAMASYAHQRTNFAKYILVRPDFRDRHIHELTRQDWRKIFGPNGSLINEHGLSPASHNRVRSLVHKFYEDARRDYEPPRALENPIHDIPELKEPKIRPPLIPTHELIRAYVQSAYQDHQPSWGIYVMLALNTGLRQSNIMAIRWKDVDWDASRIWIREKYTRAGFLPGTKSGADERVVGVTQSLKQALLHHQSVSPYKAPEDFVVTKSRGRPLRDSDIWENHRRTIKRAGIPYVKPHALRHTYASHYLNAGGSIHDLKLNLFHSSITVTEKYAHALPSELGRRSQVFQVEATPQLTKKG
jgi:integrase